MGKTYEVLSGAGTAIWSGPGRRCNKIGTYPCGARVNVLEERTGWGRTDKGWVPLIYLDDVNSPPRVQADIIRTPLSLSTRQAIRRQGLMHLLMRHG